MKLCECGCGRPTLLAKRTKTAQGHRKGEPLRFINGHNVRHLVGPLHPEWKGDEAGYMAVHNWLRRSREKIGLCDECGKLGRTDWANISGEYRRDLDDYRELCRGCHVAQDRVRDSATGRYLPKEAR